MKTRYIPMLAFLLFLWPGQGKAEVDLMDRRAVEFSLLDNSLMLGPWYQKKLATLNPEERPIPFVRACWAMAYINSNAAGDLLQEKLPRCIEVAAAQRLYLEWAALRYLKENTQNRKEKFAAYEPFILKLISEVKATGDKEAIAYVTAKLANELLSIRDVDKSLPLVVEANNLVDSTASRSLIVYEETKTALSTSLDYRDFREESSEVDEGVMRRFRSLGIRRALGVATYNRGFSRLMADPPDEAGATADLMEAMRIASLVKDDFIHATSLYSLGLQLGRGKKYPEAMAKVKSALGIFELIGDQHWINVCRLLLADYNLKSGDFKAALPILDQVDKDLPDDQRERRNAIYWYRYKAYRGLKDLENAMINLEKFQKNADAIARGKDTEEYNKAAASLNLQLEQEKSKSLAKENQLQQQQLEEAQRFQVFVIIFGVLALSTMGLLALSMRQVKRIKASKRKIQMILDHIDEGLLTVDRKRRIGVDYSLYLKKLLGLSTGIAGEDFMQVVFGSSQVPSDQKAIVEQVLHAAFSEERLVWELNSENLSREIQMGPQGERTIAIRWIPIFNRHETMDTLLVSLTDVTQERALEKALSTQERRLRSLPQSISELLQGKPALIHQLLTRTEEILRNFSGDHDVAAFLRELHTQKGVARTLGLRTLSQDLHELETSLKSSDEEIERHVLSTREHVAEFQSFASILYKNSDDRLPENLQAVLAPQLAVWMRQMQDADLPLREIRVLDSHLKWSEEEIALVQDMCLHGVSNSLDHGFIRPKKSGSRIESPTLEIRAQEIDGHLRLEIRDNGVGLDLLKLQTMARERGFTPGPGETVSDLLFQDGISTAKDVSLTSGRGVGLAAVKNRILKRGGAIGIQNNERGRGTVLWALLPLQPPANTDSALAVAR